MGRIRVGLDWIESHAGIFIVAGLIGLSGLYLAERQLSGRVARIERTVELCSTQVSCRHLLDQLIQDISPHQRRELARSLSIVAKRVATRHARHPLPSHRQVVVVHPKAVGPSPVRITAPPAPRLPAKPAPVAPASTPVAPVTVGVTPAPAPTPVPAAPVIPLPPVTPPVVPKVVCVEAVGIKVGC